MNRTNFFFNEDTDSIALNEGTGSKIVLTAFAGLFGFLAVSNVINKIKDSNKKKEYRKLLNIYASKRPKVLEFSKTIKSIRNISLAELCKKLNLKEKDAIKLRQELTNNLPYVTIKAIFDEKDNIIGFACDYSFRQHNKIVYNTRNPKLDKEQVFFISALLEYHFNIQGKFLKELERIESIDNTAKDNKDSDIYKVDKDKKRDNYIYDVPKSEMKAELEKEVLSSKKYIETNISKTKMFDLYKCCKTNSNIFINDIDMIINDNEDNDSSLYSYQLASDDIRDYSSNIINKYKLDRYIDKYYDEYYVYFYNKCPLLKSIETDVKSIVEYINKNYKYIKAVIDPDNNDSGNICINIRFKYL